MVTFRLRNFPTHITWSLKDLFIEKGSSDVTLVSDDQIQFQAHKSVLSAYSPVIKNLLLDNPHFHPLIYLRGVEQQELGYILQFMYHGEAAIPQNRIDIFFDNVNNLQIKQLTDRFVMDNTFVKREDEHANNEDNAKLDYIRNMDIDMPENHDDLERYAKDTRSISSTIDELLALEIPTYNPDKDRPDLNNHSCGECGACYKNKGTLVVHIKSKHECIKYSCKQCEYQATNKHDLRRHVDAIHEGVRYICNQCDYSGSKPVHC